MTTITIDEAAGNLKRLIHDAAPGEEIVLTEDGKQVARLVAAEHIRRPIVLGTAKDIPHFMADDFDAPMEEFRDYM